MQRGRPYLVGNQEFAALYGVRAPMIGQWMSRGVLDPARAKVISGAHYWPLRFAVRFGESTPRPKSVDDRLLQSLIAEQGPGWMPESREELPPILGQHEVRVLFRLPSQGTLATTIATGRFPAPDWLLSGSRLWMLETLLAAAPHLQMTSRSLPWQVDEDIVASLRAGRYSGPGSVILARGRAATRI